MSCLYKWSHVATVSWSMFGADWLTHFSCTVSKTFFFGNFCSFTVVEQTFCDSTSPNADIARWPRLRRPTVGKRTHQQNNYSGHENNLDGAFSVAVFTVSAIALLIHLGFKRRPFFQCNWFANYGKNFGAVKPQAKFCAAGLSWMLLCE